MLFLPLIIFNCIRHTIFLSDLFKYNRNIYNERFKPGFDFWVQSFVEFGWVLLFWIHKCYFVVWVKVVWNVRIKNVGIQKFYFARPEEYKKKVSEFVKKYATEEALRDPAEVIFQINHLIKWSIFKKLFWKKKKLIFMVKNQELNNTLFL